MQLNFKFRQQEWSDEIVDYATHRLTKLEKFEWQPLNAHITFVAERHLCCVDIRLTGQKMEFKASAKAESYAEAVDAVVAKLQKQLERKKNQVQDHLVFENTHEGKLQHEDEDFSDTLFELETPVRKAGS